MNEEVRAASARPTLNISAMAGKRRPKEFLKFTFENLRALYDIVLKQSAIAGKRSPKEFLKFAFKTLQECETSQFRNS